MEGHGANMSVARKHKPIHEDKGPEGLSTAELLENLHATPDGLAPDEAARRLAEYGYNEIAEKKVNPLIKLLSYFWGPIPWMIEAAAVLSAVVRHWADFWIILVLLAMNAAVGFWEEYQAGNAIEMLKKTLPVRARVKRGGNWTTVASRELVPGDVVRLRTGDIVPADARLLEGEPLEADQSALTGESLPVEKKPGEGVYSGSIIRQGETDALVYGTGGHTFFGKTARLVGEVHEVSHFQKAVLKVGDYLIILAAVLVTVILATALFRGDSMATTLQFALVLTVAAIPVALPTVLSVTMAVGARVLAGKNAIVSRLAAIEEMAGVDILCTDKTGTLTKNNLTTDAPYCAKGEKPQDVMLYAALASREENRDPIDLAVLDALKDKNAAAGYTLKKFTPFDPVSKKTEAAVQAPDGHTFKVAKGAPQVILALSGNKAEVGPGAEEAVAGFASRGFRSLGVARTDTEGRWVFCGVIPLYDPPRDDSKETIENAQKMGIRIKMVTGDQIAIAREIATELGLGTNILDAGMFSDTGYDEAAGRDSAIEDADGFAQVYPEHKYHIVDVLQKRGHITGMTGDGVNDAPALKKADAGIAVAGATDAARSAADIVVLSPGISVIIDAVKESRKIFQRMNSYATYRIAETIRVLLFMTLSIIVFNFYPVTAVMIVLLALLNDGAILSIAFDRARYTNKPEAWNMRMVLGIATVLGVAGVIASFGLFYIAETIFHMDRFTIQTLMYLKLSVAGHMTIFVTRTKGPFWSDRPANILLAAVLGTQTIATLLAVYGVLMHPIGWGWALAVWGYAFAWLVFNDRMKLLAIRVFNVNAPGLLAKKIRA